MYIPLLVILKNLVLLNGLEILFILMLIIIICNRYINSFIVKLINKLVCLIPNKYLPKNINKWLDNLNKVRDFNRKFYKIMFVIILIILLLVKLLHLYFSFEIYQNIDDYILVYNYIKKNT